MRTVEFNNGRSKGYFVGYFQLKAGLVAMVETFEGQVVKVPTSEIRFTDRDHLPVCFVVFKDPSDFPGQYVIRKQVGQEMRDVIAKGKTIESVVKKLPNGLTKSAPAENDHKSIVEVWR